MNTRKVDFKERWRRTWFFFPFQLLLYQFKRNHFLLLFWILLFGLVTEQFATKYGIPSLLFYPEYLNDVSFLSHFILGFATGGYVMAFHISSYIANGFKFPFIATLGKPFMKYSLNNSLVPTVFLVVYVYHMVYFQIDRELVDPYRASYHVFGFMTGVFSFIFLSLSYFLGTNRSVSKMKRDKKAAADETDRDPVVNLLHKEQDWTEAIQKSDPWRIKTYMAHPFSIKLARPAVHYRRDKLRDIIRQNHINASLFEAALVITVVTLGFFGDNEFLFIPAGASIILVLTLILMIYSAFRSWLKNWAPITIVAIFIFINFLSQYRVFNYINYAFGLNYTTEQAEYSSEKLKANLQDNRVYEDDVYAQKQTLDLWKAKNSFQKGKPKLVLVNCSGGGSRSATWTYNVLQTIDSMSNGKFFDAVHFISGSSGGMIGAAYYREQKLREKTQQDTFSFKQGFENISRDILNPVAYTYAVKDIFFRPKNLEMGGHVYIRDRGYAFEKQLHQNTDSLLAKELWEYGLHERKSVIPTFALAPTITNDGRRLIISSSHLSFLCYNNVAPNIQYQTLPESIEFKRFFKNQAADSLHFSSALRMSSTFPYVLPNVSLPSEPTIEVMDAGVRDNFGLLNNLNYIFHMRDWLQKNTSGVIILQIRDTPKEVKIAQNPVLSLFKSIFNPLGGFYRNWIKIQTYNQDLMLQYLSQAFNGKMWVYNIELFHQEQEGIPISWHLTQNEQEIIRKTVHDSINRQRIDEALSLVNLKSNNNELE